MRVTVELDASEIPEGVNAEALFDLIERVTTILARSVILRAEREVTREIESEVERHVKRVKQRADQRHLDEIQARRAKAAAT